MDQKKIGEFICKLRKEKGLTQANLAEMLSISNRTISKWENGDGLPDIGIIQELANTLGVTVDELLSAEKKEVAQLKVTEVESKSTVENWFKITYVVSLFFAIFGAVLAFVTLTYNIWAFNILFYNHWEILFVAVSLCSVVASGLFYSIGVTKLTLSYQKNEIISIAGKKGLLLGVLISVLPVMFLLRIIDVLRIGLWFIIITTLILIIWIIAIIMIWRKLNEKSI